MFAGEQADKHDGRDEGGDEMHYMVKRSVSMMFLFQEHNWRNAHTMPTQAITPETWPTVMDIFEDK